MALGFAVGKRVVVRVYHGAPDSKMPPNGTVMRIRCQCILHGCGMTKSINLIAPAFATMSAAISAVKPNEITRMCSMLMPNDAATSPPNTKPSGAVLQVLIVRPHCRECCSPTIPSHLVGRSSGFVGLLSVVGRVVLLIALGPP